MPEAADIRIVMSRPRTSTLAAASLTAALLAASPASAAHMQLFYDSLNNAAPTSIQADPETGNLWFTYPSASNGVVGRITPSGAVTNFDQDIPGSSTPWDIATSAGGRVYVTLYARDEILRMNPDGTDVERFNENLHSSDRPMGITRGPDNAMWFAFYGPTAQPGGVGRIATDGHITTVTAPLLDGPTDITTGPDGNLWVTVRNRGVAKVTTGGTWTSYTSGFVLGDDPTSIVSGPDGKLWVTVKGLSGDAIASVNPADGGITRYSTGMPSLASARPEGIAAGADGRLWFTLSGGNRLGSISTSGSSWTLPATTILPSGSAPAGMTSDAAGNVWFVGSGSPARVGRLGLAAPTVGTATTDTSGTTVTVTAPVNGQGQSTSWVLDYGTTEAFGSMASGVVSSTSSADQTVTATLTGLASGAEYRYRLTATNDAGNAVGTVGTFRAPDTGADGGSSPTPTTPTTPVTTPPPTPTTTPVPTDDGPAEKPAAGKVAVVEPTQGTVMVRPPGSSRDVPLADVGGQIPIGSIIDATRGRVELTTALPGGTTQTGEFWAGRFTVTQAKTGTGMTRLITDRRPLGCSTTAAKSSLERGIHETAAKKKKKKKKPSRTLWGEDDHGRFQTQGSNSVATVRGTKWVTVETCEGTLTRVFEGQVDVRDVRAKKTVSLMAGARYLARRR